jgi:putative Holliday junction resolvase
MRVLALDHGAARCGCAISDPTGTLATPIEAVERPDSKAGLRRIVELVRELDVEQVIVGLPLRLAGGDSEQTRSARAFARRVASVAGVPVELFDERFTTVIAQRQGGRTSEDSRAAAVLLQSWLAQPGATA